MKGVVADITKHPFLRLFKVTLDNKSALNLLHVELSQVLKSKDNAFERANNVTNSKKTNAMFPKVKHSSTNKKRVQLIKNIDIKSNNNDEELREKCACKVLLTTDDAFRDAFSPVPFAKDIVQSTLYLHQLFIVMIFQKWLILDGTNTK